MKKLLTDKEVRLITQAGTHQIAPSLYLYINTTGLRTFRTRVKLANGKRSWRTIGSADKITVKEAQRKATIASTEVAETILISREFKVAFNEYIEFNKSSWKNESSERQWRQTFNDYIDPEIGSMRVEEIKPLHIAKLLKPIWSLKGETARRIRGRIEIVIDYEQARLGLMTVNPAQTRFITNLLPKQKLEEKHHVAPSLEELQDFYNTLEDRYVSHLALKWTIQHACRTSETRFATFDEIQNDVWVIPAIRMKNSKEFVSPIVGSIPQKSPRTNLLFPVRNEAMSINGMRSVVIKKGLKWDVHGIRSTFGTWCQEQGIATEIWDGQLSHTNKDKVQRAYGRSNLLELRRKVMIDWFNMLNNRK